MAFDRVEPISGAWRHTGEIAAAAWNAVALLAAGQGVKIDLRTAADFTPDRSAPVQDSPAEFSGEQIRAAMEKRFGT